MRARRVVVGDVVAQDALVNRLSALFVHASSRRPCGATAVIGWVPPAWSASYAYLLPLQIDSVAGDACPAESSTVERCLLDAASARGPAAPFVTGAHRHRSFRPTAERPRVTAAPTLATRRPCQAMRAGGGNLGARCDCMGTSSLPCREGCKYAPIRVRRS